MSDDKDLEIKHATLVRADPERVYEAFTTANGLDAWFTDGSSVDPRPGGEIRFRWRNWGPDRVSGEDGGPVLEAEKPRRFAFQWYPEAQRAGNRCAFARIWLSGYTDQPMLPAGLCCRLGRSANPVKVLC
jgi:uncharacterized protein YndB with AHSA1/START domain